MKNYGMCYSISFWFTIFVQCLSCRYVMSLRGSEPTWLILRLVFFFFYDGIKIKSSQGSIKNECPNIVVGTPGRILGLARDKDLSLKNVRHCILDECDKMLESLGTFNF